MINSRYDNKIADEKPAQKRSKLLTAMFHLLPGLLLGVTSFGLFFMFAGTPYERQAAKEKELLIKQYGILSKRLDETLRVLDDIQQRDDNLYRVMMNAEPIAQQTRRASMINKNRYEELLSLDDAPLVVSTTQKMDLLARQLYIQSNSFDEIVDLVKTQEDRLSRVPAIQPVLNKDLKRTASGYGWRMDPVYQTAKFHEGMDFSADIGTPVFATGNGVILKSGWQRGYGETIEIDHGYGYKTVYAHLNKRIARTGVKVKRGDIIGHVGNTGKSTGPHLHYEVHLNGRHRNPMHYYFLDLNPDEYDQMIQLSSNHGQVMD